MNIAIIGTGYVGLVTGACFAELGNDVTCVEIDKGKIELLKKGKSPIYEPGIEDLIRRNTSAKRLHFTNSHASAIKGSKVIFIAVGTPSLDDGRADLSQVEAAAEAIGTALDHYAVIVNKSTVPIGTSDLVARRIREHYKGEFDVVSNPEFLREGSAIQDFMQPDRVVIGDGSERARTTMKALYDQLDAPLLFTDVKTAEMIKYASNAFLATQISYINSVAKICEAVGADVTLVANGMRLDKRIGRRAFLDAGVGYGGSCFPKDVRALIRIAHENDVHFDILDAVEATNTYQKLSVIPKLKAALGTLQGKRITLWGLAFKPKTDDIREAPALTIARSLHEFGAHIKAFDPVAEKAAKEQLPYLTTAPDPLEAVKGADALVVVTEWNEFSAIDPVKIAKAMRGKVVVDGRNALDPTACKKAGLTYIGIGRS